MTAALDRLSETGFNPLNDVALNSRLSLHRITSKARSHVLRYSDMNGFDELLTSFDRVFKEQYQTLKKAHTSFYDWMYHRERIILQIGLSLLYRRLSLTFDRAISGDIASISFSKNFSLVQLENDMCELLNSKAIVYPFTVSEKSIYNDSFRDKVFDQVCASVTGLISPTYT